MTEKYLIKFPSGAELPLSSQRRQRNKQNLMMKIFVYVCGLIWHDVIDIAGHENLYYLISDSPAITKFIFEKITD